MTIYIFYTKLIAVTTDRVRKYLECRNCRVLKYESGKGMWNVKKIARRNGAINKTAVPRVDFPRKPLLSFTRFSFSGTKIEKRTAFQIGRWTGTARHIAARCRTAPSGTRGRRGKMISSLAFFSLPTLSSDLFATRICVRLVVAFLRNTHDRSSRWYLEHSHSSRHKHPRRVALVLRWEIRNEIL